MSVQHYVRPTALWETSSEVHLLPQAASWHRRSCHHWYSKFRWRAVTRVGVSSNSAAEVREVFNNSKYH